MVTLAADWRVVLRHSWLRAALAVAAASVPARSQPVGYFDLAEASIPALTAPDWTRKPDGDRLLFLCTAAERCRAPTGIEVKGVVRSETLPAAFQSGPLSPAALTAQGEANAKRMGSRFHGAEATSVAGIAGVRMIAEAAMGGPVYFVSTWLGRGNRLLDIKVTARDLAQARALADQAAVALAPQVFPPDR